MSSDAAISEDIKIPDTLITSLIASSKRRDRLREMDNEDLALALNSLTDDMPIFGLAYDIIEEASARLSVWGESPESISLQIDLQEKEDEYTDSEIEVLIADEARIMEMLKETSGD